MWPNPNETDNLVTLTKKILNVKNFNFCVVEMVDGRFEPFNQLDFKTFWHRHVLIQAKNIKSLDRKTIC